MKTQLRKLWCSLSPQQAAVIVALVVVAGWLASRWPIEFWERLAAEDPTELGLRVGLFLLAVYGVFTRARNA